MKRISLLLLCCFSVITHGFSQLTSSPQHSPLHHLYKVTNYEAREIFRKGRLRSKDYRDALLNPPVATFPANKGLPDSLPPGHYLEVYAQQSRVKYSYHTIENIRYKFIPNGTHPAVVVHDLQGRIVTGAIVKFRGRYCPFDTASQTYPLGHGKRSGLLEVRHDNLNNLFRLERETFSYRRPFSFRRLFTRLRYHHRPSRHNYSGYLALNKPKFKPGDTVKLKAFIRDRKGRPVNTPAWLRLSETYNDPDIDTILSQLHPYRPGAFEYSFVLHDSLDLELDDDYQLTLEGGRNKPRRADAEEDDDNERPRRSKQQVMLREKFGYEEYELGTVTFSARTDQSRHTRGTPMAVYLKATDENNLPVLDGRVKISVVRSHVQRTYQPMVFIPDTLWLYEVPLEPTGETKVTLPDSIFPAASIGYAIHCQFLSASNESQWQRLSQSYNYPTEEISFKEQADSLEISSLISGKSVPDEGQLILLMADGEQMQNTRISLPAKIPMHPFAGSYVVKTDKANNRYTPTSLNKISGIAHRTRDSVFLQLSNPSHLPFWYTIYAGKKIVERGYHQGNLDRKIKANTLNDYTVSWQYISSDAVMYGKLSAPYADKLLQVNIDAPLTVFPGQTSRLTVSVKDVEGKPVPDADVTSYAATSKFGDFNLPFVPYYGKLRARRLPGVSYRNDKTDIGNASETYSHERWGQRLALDTSVYYQFIQPKGISSLTEPVTGNVTQLAPFITINGAPQKIIYLWIDGKPAYLEYADLKPNYSFPVAPGYHQLRLRTAVNLVTADSVYVTAGRKTFLNINIANKQPNVQVRGLSRTFSKTEKSELQPYFVRFFQPVALPVYSYIQQDDRLLAMLRREGRSFSAWPLEPRPATLHARGLYAQSFTPASGGLLSVVKDTFQYKATFPEKFNQIHADYRFYEFPLFENALNPQIIDSLFREHQENTRLDYTLNSPQNNRKNGRGRLQFSPDTSYRQENVKQVFLYRYQDPSFYRIQSSGSFDFGELDSGWYRLLVLLRNNRYQLIDSLCVRDHGTTVYQLSGQVPVLPADKVSRGLAAEIWEYVTDTNRQRYYTGQTTFSSAFNDQYLDAATLVKTIEGVVTDEDDKPLAGVSIQLKNTGFGTATDANGRFRMKVTEYGTLKVYMVGFNSEEVNLNQQEFLQIKLTANKASLQEVIVTGMGMSGKRNLAGAVAGITVRGMGFIGNTGPLIIVDGKVYDGLLETIDPATIGSINVLKGDAATGVYGARAANGAIIIVSAGGRAQPPAGNNLRQRFRDDAFWQPRLRTNENGEASFDVTFPDDITNWRTFAIAMAERKLSGSATTSIKSFQPLATNLALPAFAVAGDTLQALGKILNYTPDSVTLERRFYADDKLLLQGTAGVRNSHLDTVTIAAPQQGDSLALKFTIHRESFMDGERRAIPLFRQGVTETTGVFLPLRTDTTFRVPVTDTGAVKVYASSSLLPVIHTEITRLKGYEYSCNEQMASKLIAVLQEKQLCTYEQQEFRGEKLLRQLLRALAGNQYLGGWGWWGKSEPLPWITKHVASALLMAERAGYTAPVNKQDFLDYQQLLLKSPGGDKLTIVETLQQLGAKIDYRRCLDTLPAVTAYDKARKMYILQRAGETVNTASLLQHSQRSMMGNPYWGEESLQLHSNNVQYTLLVYKILRQQSGQEATLAGIRDWLLERRYGGSWRNTYEAATILETILPDLLQKAQPLTATLTLNGHSITQFPFDTVIRTTQPLQIGRQGNATVYFSATQEHWNAAPEAVSRQFTVQSSLESGGQPLSRLVAGTVAELRADVTVAADADYVMIEIPIPAGCSYAAKAQSYAHGEVHREHFKQKVSIFCGHLPKGKHTFTVSLMPRYSGTYHLNPAKASLMYFPTFFGRTGMKQVIITGK
ncbi:carboxypeptidase-like regulatory domain-containing protein [Chitinophaga oryzae]|uniref:Carboxypeptidase-like regulatory domain-containing protein n=1 Tax=Chitinophaga oryzae TaxID=2725414 RepID=A0AAE7D7I4_9BACT|nr:alpha-2-macroglobulin family protein [Chitinophaga oryzae]QJB32417.1 carboxypeptidase-like regulatory domain-containing protein [Chitinophaga oryzae]